MLVPGRVLGEVEEYLIEHSCPAIASCSQVRSCDLKVCASSMPLSRAHTRQSTKCLLMRVASSRSRPNSPSGCACSSQSQNHGRDCQVSDWLRFEADVSVVPSPDEILVETFPRGKRHYLVCYPFEGRLAHQSLGMLLARRLERAGAAPFGFVANEYALAIWGLNDMGEMARTGRLDLAKLFDQDMLGDDLGAWLACSSLMKRSFRVCAIISGLIERRHP